MLIGSLQNDPYQILLNSGFEWFFKLIYSYLNKGDLVHECYSCLKMKVQAHLHLVFSQYFSVNVRNLNDYNFCIKYFTTPDSKYIIATLRIVSIEKNWVDILSNSEIIDKSECVCMSMELYSWYIPWNYIPWYETWDIHVKTDSNCLS